MTFCVLRVETSESQERPIAMKNRMFGGIGAMALVEDDLQIPGTIDRATGRIQSADLSALEVDDMSDDLAETELRMKGEVVVVPAEQMPSATASVWLIKTVFFFMHVACLGVFLTGVNVQDLALCGSVYLLQMVGITIGYHRYLSHRSFRTSRVFQFVLAGLGCSAAQKGPLWWAAHHRHHHRTSDTPEDLHSPVAHSIWRAHVGWVLSRDSDDTDEQSVNDLIRFSELRWLDRYHWSSPLVVGVLCFVAGGWSGLVWGFFVSSVLSHHATFLVNSACHLWGRRRFATADASRNNWFVALLTLGEGWHNNHHHYQSSANQGFRWWELDVSYYLIRLLAFVGLVWDVRTPPPEKLSSVIP